MRLLNLVIEYATANSQYSSLCGRKHVVSVNFEGN